MSTFCSTVNFFLARAHLYTSAGTPTVIASCVADFKSSCRRAEDIEERHNLWANRGLLDGTYPALFWDYDMTVYGAAASPMAFLKWYTSLCSFHVSDPRTLTIQYNSTVIINCGACYLRAIEKIEPNSDLYYAAGLVSMKFVGTEPPAVTV